jgi:hypothetical protein
MNARKLLEIAEKKGIIDVSKRQELNEIINCNGNPRPDQERYFSMLESLVSFYVEYKNGIQELANDLDYSANQLFNIRKKKQEISRKMARKIESLCIDCNLL